MLIERIGKMDVIVYVALAVAVVAVFVMITRNASKGIIYRTEKHSGGCWKHL